MKLFATAFLIVSSAAMVSARAQDDPKPPLAAPAPAPAVQSPEVKPVPVAPADMPKGAKPARRETKEAIRDLQVQQDRVLLAIKQNELDRETLLKRSADFDATINAALQDDAKRQKIDVGKFTFNLDTMLWSPKGESK